MILYESNYRPLGYTAVCGKNGHTKVCDLPVRYDLNRSTAVPSFYKETIQKNGEKYALVSCI